MTSRSTESKINEIWSSSGPIDIVLLAHGVLGDPRKAEVDQNELFYLLNSNFVSHASL